MKRGRSNLYAVISALILGFVAVSLTPPHRISPLLAGDKSSTPDHDDDPAPQLARVDAGQATPQPDQVSGDWPQWGGSGARNNTPVGSHIPEQWDIGGIDVETGQWTPDDAVNIKWVSRVGSQTYGNPVVAGGHVFVGTNNGAGYLARYPDSIDLGCLLAFREADGQFLWQHSNEKLPTGRVHDWPLQGVCCAPLVEGNRLWYVCNRGEVVCLDTEGFYDGEDDGPVKGEWGRLFLENPAVHAGLDDGYLSTSLRALFAQAGASLEGRVIVKAITKGKNWAVAVRDRDGTSHEYAVTLDDGGVSMYQLVTGDAQKRLLVHVPPLVQSGLDDGQVSPALRGLLAERGMALPQTVDITTDQPGAKWTLSASIGGRDRQIRISKVGPNLTAFKRITVDDKHEADTVWTFDMMKELGVSQHNMCSCSVTALGDILFVNTSNGIDETHINVPAPNAPSFMAMSKTTGDVLWTDKSPGINIVHGQWSSPAVGVLAGVPQVIFAGGDGWVYSFRADRWDNGKPELLWKFDANPKESKWILGGRGTRNNIIATPVLYEGLVYVAVGQDPEHGEGIGHLWCIDPSKRGDVSPQLAMKVEGDKRVPLPHRRLQAVIPEQGEVAVDNPNSAAVWHYSQFDQNGDGEFDFEEVMHRSCGTVAIKDGILYIADFSGLFHCLDAKTGKVHWTYDMLAAAWGSPLIVDGKVYIGDEDGDVCVFRHTSEPHEPVAEIYMENSVYSTPIVANNVLFIANRSHLFAIQEQGE